ncbi:hypothetical protein TNCV_783571 [Trichonephila clavipes]|nr:hypothetical protein TNCV_783571 [Trichonephila clavipes]
MTEVKAFIIIGQSWKFPFGLVVNSIVLSHRSSDSQMSSSNHPSQMPSLRVLSYESTCAATNKRHSQKLVLNRKRLCPFLRCPMEFPTVSLIPIPIFTTSLDSTKGIL